MAMRGETNSGIAAYTQRRVILARGPNIHTWTNEMSPLSRAKDMANGNPKMKTKKW